MYTQQQTCFRHILTRKGRSATTGIFDALAAQLLLRPPVFPQVLSGHKSDSELASLFLENLNIKTDKTKKPSLRMVLNSSALLDQARKFSTMASTTKRPPQMLVMRMSPPSTPLPPKRSEPPPMPLDRPDCLGVCNSTNNTTPRAQPPPGTRRAPHQSRGPPRYTIRTRRPC